MTPKKQIIQDFEAGREVPTQELAAAVEAEVKSTPAAPKATRFIAYAPFDFKGKFEFKSKHYEPGDEFTPPENLTRDASFDTFRAVEKRNQFGGDFGIAFIELGGIISKDPKVRNDPLAERYTYRHVLPLKEE